MQPRKNKIIQLKLNNLSTYKMTLFLKFNSAKTNESSVIEHSLNIFIKDPSLAYDLSSNVTGTDKVELESKNNKVVTLTIRPPIEV
ncbi:WxL protein peptidoglycan domain-containing protein [Enterococcus haemoperoxidus]|uniref:WxL protein peptidoglycan domain-containing protein n=1 Tax=Enterococcus haemoperoxidus TaxID=155618 RepID=UPI0009DC3857|nr:DUF916 domain-containing protein [Enterococcus haemoperoxidus]